ncbi:MAG: phosphate/phosphite/phosphonate ABC transporter substrate-binding protein [Janthinobacterium lividum]
MTDSNWVAALPMYNVTPHVAAGWRELLWELIRRVSADTGGAPLQILSPDDTDLQAFWSRADLLLSQTCGYPFTHGLAGTVQLVASPIFDAPGCSNTDYSSVLVTRRADRRGTLEAYRGSVAAYNGADSHSGMNAFRHAVAPLANAGRFFAATVRTGSHLNSLRAVAAGHADIAAVDCVTLAFARDHLPGLVEPLHTLAYTEAAAGLPLITSTRTDPGLLELIRGALDDVLSARRALARRLRLLGFVALPASAYGGIVEMEQAAMAAGYPKLA